MLKVSEIQLQSMRGVFAEELYEDLLRFARRELPEHVSGLDDDALRARIRDDAEVARSYGVTSRRGITHFVGLSLIAPKKERFWTRPEAAELLAGPDVEAKLDLFIRQFSMIAIQRGLGA